MKSVRINAIWRPLGSKSAHFKMAAFVSLGGTIHSVWNFEIGQSRRPITRSQIGKKAEFSKGVVVW